MYLIQGFFCQMHEGLGTRYVPGGMGTVAVIEKKAISVAFRGIIQDDLSEGEVSDLIGEATLSKITMTSDVVEFEKRYRDRSQSQGIYYSLHLERNTWVGTYQAKFRSDEVWGGPVRCVITKVDEALFRGDLEEFAAKYRREHPPQVCEQVHEEEKEAFVDDGGDIPF